MPALRLLAVIAGVGKRVRLRRHSLSSGIGLSSGTVPVTGAQAPVKGLLSRLRSFERFVQREHLLRRPVGVMGFRKLPRTCGNRPAPKGIAKCSDDGVSKRVGVAGRHSDGGVRLEIAHMPHARPHDWKARGRRFEYPRCHLLHGVTTGHTCGPIDRSA